MELTEVPSRESKKVEKGGKPAAAPRWRITKCPAPASRISFAEWKRTIEVNFPDLVVAAQAALSVVAQFLIKDITNPFALVLVDVPSSGKTIAINFFANIPEITYATDKFT